jgi:hypothetical protein
MCDSPAPPRIKWQRANAVDARLHRRLRGLELPRICEAEAATEIFILGRSRKGVYIREDGLGWVRTGAGLCHGGADEALSGAWLQREDFPGLSNESAPTPHVGGLYGLYGRSPAKTLRVCV